ncbi:MAG: serine--tRNA ligase [Nanoarchaeota archaeon]
MLDIHFLREQPEQVKASEKKRGRDPALVDLILALDQQWRAELKKLEELKHTRNVVSEEINQAKKSGDKALAEKKIRQMKQVAEEIKEGDYTAASRLQQRDELLKKLGNVLDKSVPEGKNENDNKELKKVGKIPKFSFPIKDHIELGLELDLIDLETAARNSGARFYYLKNEAVLLSQALQRLAIDRLRKKGYLVIQTPYMLNRAALEGGVNLTEFEETLYKIENEDLYLIATSEHPLVALKKNQLLSGEELPIKICGVSACFRKELGAHGRDTKGIFRVHQFHKVEQIIYCLPENSARLFEEMQRNAEELFKELGIPFRVVAICSGDLGNKQALQYDIEAWFPGQNGKKGMYREVTSCSNCTNYQSVTLNTRYLNKEGAKEYVHILNNTALTDTRPIIAILENFQTKQGTVKIPKVLWKYLGGIKEIGKRTTERKER